MKRLARFGAAGVTAALIGGLGWSLALAVPRWRGARSDHFDGERFFNPDGNDQHGAFDFLRWRLQRREGPWQRRPDALPGPPPPQRVAKGELRVTFVNHATVLLQLDGVNVLTDPIWSERCSPVPWAGPRRYRPPGIRFEDLPPIDAVLLSHNHYDHTDLPTLRRLAARHHPVIAGGLGLAALLEREGIAGGVELDWWQSLPLAEGVTLRALPAQHFSGRSLADRNRALWCGWGVEGSAGWAYVAGDTGWSSHFAEIRERLGPPRAALLPIGAYLPRWFMSAVHIDPAQAIAAARVLQAGLTIPMHYGTFHLGDDGEREPLDDLARAVAALPEAERPAVRVLAEGEGTVVPEWLPRHDDGAPQLTPEGAP